MPALARQNGEGAEVTKLLKVGRKLAVLGIATDPAGAVWDSTKWHIMNPGSYSVPQIGGVHNHGLSVGRTLCGFFAWTNGYASDHRPPEGALCQACAERV